MSAAGSRQVFDAGGAQLVGERHNGDGPRLVALHAGVADRRSWRDVTTHLEGAVTLISYDRRGYGDSQPAARAFSHLEDLTRVLDALGEDPVWLLGNSMGGRLALDMALQAPGRVAGLVLLSPAISGAPEDPLDPDTQRLSDLLDSAWAAEDLEEVNRLETWLWLDGPGSEEGRVGDPPRGLALAMNAIVLANESEQAELERESETAAWNRLSEIRVPVTVACGTLDVAPIIDQSQTLAQQLARGRFVALPGMAHLPSLEAPRAVAGLIGEALDAGH
jgi:pimeloyl-ACP methyl ester carboxylesterase